MQPHHSRRERRHSIKVYGRFRYNGRAYEIPLLDLSEHGCRFFDRHGTLKVGTELLMHIEKLGPFSVIVRWSKDEYVGVEFATPLYGPILDHIVSLYGGKA